MILFCLTGSAECLIFQIRETRTQPQPRSGSRLDQMFENVVSAMSGVTLLPCYYVEREQLSVRVGRQT